jgi:hypothetical protein
MNEGYICTCPQCDTVALVELTPDQIRELVVGPDNRTAPLLWICRECEFEWYAPPDGVLRG